MRYFVVIVAVLCLLGALATDFRANPIVVDDPLCADCAEKKAEGLRYETCAARSCTRCADCGKFDRCCCLHIDKCTCPEPPPNPSRRP